MAKKRTTSTTITISKEKKNYFPEFIKNRDGLVQKTIYDIKYGKTRFLTKEQYEYEKLMGKKAKNFNGTITKQFKDYQLKPH